MKKIILNSIAILGLAISAFSQDGITMKIVGGDGTDYSSGHSPYIVNVNAANDYPVDIEVTNTTGSAKSWRLTRDSQSDVPSTWTNSVCFGVTCFAASTLNPYCTPASTQNNNFTLDVANGASGTILFHITADAIGTGTYKLYLGDCTNFDDSITVQLNYTAGIKELKQTPSFSMFPNPSDEFVSIQMNNADKGLVKVIDLLGNVIYSESIITSSKINTSDFKNGVYFITIESEGLKLASRKLVVRH